VFTKGKGIRKDEVVPYGTPCVRYGEIYTHYNDYIREFRSFIPDEVALESCRIMRGDLLFAGSGETAEDIGKCVAFLGEEEAYAGGDIVIFTPYGQDSMYLGYLMNHSSITCQKARMAQGDAVVHISAANLGQLQLSLPPLSEQRAIASALSDVDALISSLDKLIAKKRDIKQAAMQQLLTGRRRLPGFKCTMERVRLGNIAQIVGGGTPRTGVAEYWDGEIRWCTPSDITACRGKYLAETTSNITYQGLKSSAAQLLPPGTLLLCSRATVGEVRIAATEICTNQGFKSLVCGDRVNNEYLYYAIPMMKPRMVEKASGSTFLELSKKDAESLELYLPPFDEQVAIASVLSDMDAEIEALERRRDKTRLLKQGMMQELLTGRVRLV